MICKKQAIGILAIFLVAITVAGVSAATSENEVALNKTETESMLDLPNWQQVNSSGFGDSTTGEITALESFNNYLYAGTHNPIDPEPLFDGAQIFRSPDGLTWNAVTQPGFGNAHDIAPPAILDFAVFKGFLYAGTGRGNASQLWRSSNGTIWAPMDVTGFSDPDNVNITALVEYGGKLYAGVTNQVSGVQIWSSSTGDNNSWTKQTTPTLPEMASSVTGFAVFNGALYAAVEFESNSPVQVWRSYGGAWTSVISDGFGDSDNTLTGGMVVFGGYLYLGSGNTSSGAQLWRTSDGEVWTSTITAAFGDANNVKAEMVIVYENQLYVSVKNTATGMEIWRSADGSIWEQVNQDGFGDNNNAATNWSNASAKFSNQLYVGTVNIIDGGEVWRMQPPYGVALSADQFLSGPVGGQVSYSLMMTNTGTMTDSIDLTATGQTWSTTLSNSLVNLAPSASTIITATVSIPADAINLDTDSVTITATSQGDISKTDTAVLTTTSIAAPVYGVALSADESLSGPVGGQVSYNLTITNTGNVADIFDLLLTGNNWLTTPSSQVVSLAAAGHQVVTVTVSIPPQATASESDQVTVQATSRHDSSKNDSAILTTISLGQSTRIYLPIVLLNSTE